MRQPPRTRPQAWPSTGSSRSSGASIDDQRFGAAGFTEAEITVGREVDRLSRAWGLAPYQVSLAWLLFRPTVASAIVGAETLDELRANVTAADVALEPAQLDSLTALASETAAFHHRAGQGPQRPTTTTD